MLFIGLDIGSSSVKASLFDANIGYKLASVYYPEKEMEIHSPKPGWAEQDPEVWFENVRQTIFLLKEKFKGSLKEVKGIGISYQMHGLVAIDLNGKPIRDAIIWCDSRAVETGHKAFEGMGQDYCINNLLNSPGNFTASKLKWMQDNEPENYKRIHKIMLPGDYIAYRLTGEIMTTEPGLSEGIFWDFTQNKISQRLLEYYKLDPDFIPQIAQTFSDQGHLTLDMADNLGLSPGIPVTYRAGDQPNNAFSLNVLNPGEVAATAGTSGVVYGVTENQKPDPLSRVNTFLHVNHNDIAHRYGVLLCINGTGILNSWLKQNIMPINANFEEMNKMAESIPKGSDGLMVFPFGNGAERVLENKNINSSIVGLNFNIHSRAHLIRASQEGIIFSMIYGLDTMRELGLDLKIIKAAMANMFLSPIFRNTLASISGAEIELYNTEGSEGAARGAAIGYGFYKNMSDAFVSLDVIEKVIPKKDTLLMDAYHSWKQELNKILKEF